jgi:hypothetical protein
MKLTVLYRPNSEYARMVEEYMHEFTRLHAEADTSLVDIDSAEGILEAGVYDIMEFPALIATSNDGSLLSMWTGEQLPLMDEVMGYING